MIRQIKTYLNSECELLQMLDCEAITQAVNLIRDVRENSKTIYTCGNGGSAATASHFACDFGKGATMKLSGKPFKWICLNDNIPILTAISNDISYDDCFAFQINNLMQEGDVLFAISGSGNSKNIIRAAEAAKEKGCRIIGLTGFDGGKLKMLSDIFLHVPINDMQLTEDVHMILDHLMLRIV